MAGATKIVICSKLPHGLILNLPQNPSVKVDIRGLNSGPKGVNGARVLLPYITTEVDKDFWDSWILLHAKFPAVTSGAIFAAKTDDEVKKKAREQEKQLTGLEQTSRTWNGVHARKDND